MKFNNQIPASETSTTSPETQQADSFSLDDAEALLNEFKGRPALLKPDQVNKSDQWLIDTRTERRLALSILLKPFDDLEAGILNDRDLAVVMADAYQCAVDVESGLKLMLDLVLESQLRILVSLSGRDDGCEIMSMSDQEHKAAKQASELEAAEKEFDSR